MTRVGAQEVCEIRDGRPGLPVPNSPYGLCARKVDPREKILPTLKKNLDDRMTGGTTASSVVFLLMTNTDQLNLRH